MMIPAYRIPQLALTHREAISELQCQLATNPDESASSLVNKAISRMGIDRITYQRIIVFMNGWQYAQVSERLLAQA